MVVGEDIRRVDALVVGSGPGGYTAAAEIGRTGRRVLLVERDQLGGTCLNVGCIPSKALLHIADLVDAPRRSSEWGLVAQVQLDMPLAQKRIRAVIDELRADVSNQLRTCKVEIARGAVTFLDRNEANVDAGEHHYRVEFSDAVIATGSRPAELPCLPCDHQVVLDSSDALALEELPTSVAIIGGGYIGVELATAFSKLGSAVTIVEATDRLLPDTDAELVRVVAGALAARGVDVITRGFVTGRTDAGIAIEADGAARTVACAKVIVATGRRPNTGGLGIEHLKVKATASGHIVVDERSQAGERIYAVGDVTAGPALAHRATAQARVVAENIAGRATPFAPICVPAVVYSDPPILQVGRTAEDARAAGLSVSSVRRLLRSSGRAMTTGRPEGHLTLVFDSRDRHVVGIHAVGSGVEELAGEAAVAIEMGACIDDLELIIHPHPSLNELIQDAGRHAVLSLDEQKRRST